MKRTIAAAIAAAVLAMPAGAQVFANPPVFGLEFWPATPNRTRQVQHFIACPVGARLDFKTAGAAPPNAELGAFVFVGRTMPKFLGLYKIDRFEVKRNADDTVAEVRIGAICTTGLEQ